MTAEKFTKTRITALMPADRWFAVLLHDDAPWFFLERVVCFAVEREAEDERDVIDPFIFADGFMQNAYDFDQFHTLIHADDITEAHKTDWIEAAPGPKENRMTSPVYTIAPGSLRGLGDGIGSTPWKSQFLASQLTIDRRWSSEQRLCYAILLDAVELVLGLTPQHGYVQNEAKLWLQSRSAKRVFDFEQICLTLDLDPDWIREGIFGRQR